jgi:hypothetical protein
MGRDSRLASLPSQMDEPARRMEYKDSLETFDTMREPMDAFDLQTSGLIRRSPLNNVVMMLLEI